MFLASIGYWETGCGTKGAGRDWYFGFDYFPGAMKPEYKGFANQLAGTAAFVQNCSLPISPATVLEFSRSYWKAGSTDVDRVAWANGVWGVLAGLVDDLTDAWLTQTPVAAVTAGLWTNVPSLANMASPAFVTALIAQTGLSALQLSKVTVSRTSSLRKFGRKKHTIDERDLPLAKYRTTLPAYPAAGFGHNSLIGSNAWGMLGNDTVGDCVQAAADHEEELWSAEGSTEAVFTDANALADYSAETGYNPDNPDSDQGTEIRVSLKYRQQTGMIDAGGKRHKIDAYLALNLDVDEALEAAYIFSAVEIGINVPNTMIPQFNANQPFDVVPGAKDTGEGHDVTIVGFDGTYILIVTWGVLWKMTLAFFKAYCEEAWALLSEGFLKSGLSPEGLDLTALDADLAALNTTPVPAPTPAPTPTPPPVPTPPATEPTAIFTCGESQVVMNGVAVPIDSNPAVTPILVDQWGRVFVPLRFTQEQIVLFGGKATTLTWDESKLQATQTESASGVNEFIEVLPGVPGE
jgi:hypothetical protein